MARRYDKPDTGYAWVILAANFVLHLLTGSFFAPLGILIVEYLERFGQSKAYTAGIGGTLLATWGLSGAFIGPLVQKFGFRRMVQVGTTLVVAGLGFSALAPNVAVLYLTHGFIAGLGFSFWSVSMFSISQLFFVRHRSFSVALCSAGISVGVFFWSNLAHLAIDNYGYRGALVVMAGVNLHGYVIAAIFRAPNFEKQPGGPKDVQYDNKESNLESSRDDTASHFIQTDVDCSGEAAKQHSEMLQEKCDVSCSQDEVYQCNDILHQMGPDAPKALNANDDCIKEPIQQGPQFTPLRGKCRVYARANIVHKNAHKFGNFCKQVLSILSSTIDISLLKIPTFSLFCIAIFLGQSGNIIPFNFIPLRVSVMGISKEMAARLITLMGLCSAIGRPLVGWIADQSWADRKLMYAVAQAVAGCSSCISYFTDDYNALVAYCTVFALASACYVSLQAAIICDLVGVSKLVKGIGLSIVFFGVAQMLATSVSGRLIDMTGDVAIPFLVVGLVQVCGGLVGLVVCVMVRRQHRKEKITSTPIDARS